MNLNGWGPSTRFPFDLLSRESRSSVSAMIPLFKKHGEHCQAESTAGRLNSKRLPRVVRRHEDRRHLRSRWFVTRLDADYWRFKKGSHYMLFRCKARLRIGLRGERKRGCPRRDIRNIRLLLCFCS